MKHFTYKEFDSPDAPGSGKDNMHRDFLKKLDKARGIAKTSFKINSGYRTPERNHAIGGKHNSSHLSGRAADISTPDSATRFKVVQACIEVGFKRIGIGRTFVHVDDDPSKTPGVIWTYYG